MTFAKAEGLYFVKHRLTASLLTDTGDAWRSSMSRLRQALGAPGNPTLLPLHFLQSAFPQIGGQVLLVHDADRLVAASFLFPRLGSDGQRGYTLRHHTCQQVVSVPVPFMVEEASRLLRSRPIVPFDPEITPDFVPSSHTLGALDMGAPDSREAKRIRDLQQQIWGSDPEALYPTDLFASSFGSSLAQVARWEGTVVAFLFGFHKFAGPPLPEPWAARYGADVRLESQVMGVLPSHRKRGIATALKRFQAEQSRRLGLKVIEWTVDPLQLANAVLNYEHLGAMAVSHRPDYYGFRNQLNQVAASRVTITWLIDSGRVARRLEQPSSPPLRDLNQLQDLQVVNEDWRGWRSDCTAPNIAMEIPPNWTALQAEAPELAWRWRQISDDILAHYLGLAPSKYVITSTGQDGSRRYLLAERVTSALLQELAA